VTWSCFPYQVTCTTNVTWSCFPYEVKGLRCILTIILHSWRVAYLFFSILASSSSSIHVLKAGSPRR
jgi:hypothetical protein